MYNKRMYHFVNFVIILLPFFELSFCQNLPFVNCPKIFQYHYDGSEWFGVIDLHCIDPGQAFKLSVDMTLSANITKNYLGSLDLKINRKETDEYKIKFPLPAVLPKLIQIRFNENIICNSPSDGLPIKTILVLEQTASGQISFDTDIRGVLDRHTESLSNTNYNSPSETEDATFLKRNKSGELSDCGQLSGEFSKYPVDYSIGGYERGTWPWLAAIFHINNREMKYRCVGTLISNRAVLTSAICVIGSLQGNTSMKVTPNVEQSNVDIGPEFIVYLGVHNLTDLAQEGVVHAKLSKFLIHPEYNKISLKADLCIFVLERQVQFSDYIRPACIWSDSPSLEKIIGENGYYAGWGIDATGSYPETPSRADSYIVSHQQCLQSHESFSRITSVNTFCSGDRNGQGPCIGDSGAGFFLRRVPQWILRGMVSLSLFNEMTKSCDLTNYVVYTDIAFFADWINSALS